MTNYTDTPELDWVADANIQLIEEVPTMWVSVFKALSEHLTARGPVSSYSKLGSNVDVRFVVEGENEIKASNTAKLMITGALASVGMRWLEITIKSVTSADELHNLIDCVDEPGPVRPEAESLPFAPPTDGAA